jgi:hypothetical protein
VLLTDNPTRETGGKATRSIRSVSTAPQASTATRTIITATTEAFDQG